MKKTLTLVLILLTSFRVFSQTPTFLFFDDFARYNRLDTTKWEPRTSVYINDHFSKNPVSKNIATFNGLSGSGQLFPSTSSITSPVDTLTSRPINLAGRTAADSVYLTFYLQTGGIGGMPVLSTALPTYFEVQFKNSSGNWIPAPRINPAPNSQRTLAFKPYLFVITDPQYLHGNFQFRFRTFGKRRTSDDTWNLDYVLLGFDRRKSELRFDVMTSRRVSSLLQRYTAMPIHQFMANIAGELNDSVFTTLNNYESQPRGIATTSTVQIGNSAPVPFATHQIPIRPNYLQYDSFPDKPAASIFNGLSGFQTIKSTVSVETREDSKSETIRNDTISRTTELRDYYAYDDGSAESVKSYLFGQGAQLGQVAQRFDINQPDRVKTISVYLPKAGNTRNTQVNFKIWNVNPTTGSPDAQTIFSKVFIVPDVAQLDNWFDISVDPSVRVTGSFYAGWTITGSQPLFYVGLDLNQNTPLRFTDFGTTWSTETEGSLMLRVAMNNNITGLSETFAASKTKIYPNPATDHVLIQGKFETLRLLNSTGQLVLEKKGNGTEMRLETQNLKPGFYLMQLQDQNQVETHKLIIQAN